MEPDPEGRAPAHGGATGHLLSIVGSGSVVGAAAMYANFAVLAAIVLVYGRSEEGR